MYEEHDDEDNFDDLGAPPSIDAPDGGATTAPQKQAAASATAPLAGVSSTSGAISDPSAPPAAASAPAPAPAAAPSATAGTEMDTGPGGTYDLWGQSDGQVSTGDAGTGTDYLNSPEFANTNDLGGLFTAAGYKPDPNIVDTNSGGDSGGGTDNAQGAELQNWLDQNGYSVGVKSTDDGSYVNLFNTQTGAEVGGSKDVYEAPFTDDNLWGEVGLGLAGGFGAATAALGGAAAGAGAGAADSAAVPSADAGLSDVAGAAGSTAPADASSATGLAGTDIPAYEAPTGFQPFQVAGDNAVAPEGTFAASAPDGVSGMDLAGDAATGTGNNITTAADLMGGGGDSVSGMDLAADAAPGTGNSIDGAAQAMDAATPTDALAPSTDSLTPDSAPQALGTDGGASIGDPLSEDASSLGGADSSYSPGSSSFSPDGAGAGNDATFSNLDSDPTAVPNDPAYSNQASTAPDAPDQAMAPSGGGSTVDQAMDALKAGGTSAASLAKTYGPLAGLGMSAYGALKAKSAQQQFDSAAAPAQQAEQQLLAQYKQGQLSATDQQQIASWAASQKAKLQQYFQSAGLSNSSMALDAMARVDQQANQMREQAVNNMLTNGLKAAGVANPLLADGINAGLKEDAATQAAIANFIKTLSSMNSGSAAAPAPSDNTGSPG